MKKNERVIFCSAEWVFIEEIDGKCLLRSTNKNIGDILAEGKYVKKFKEQTKEV